MAKRVYVELSEEFGDADSVCADRVIEDGAVTTDFEEYLFTGLWSARKSKIYVRDVRQRVGFVGPEK